MKAKQNLEVGKYFLTTSQIVLATRVIGTVFLDRPIHWLSFGVNLAVACVLFVIGVYFIGRGD